MELIRIQKFLSQCGIASRRHAEELILEGRVKVNGKVISEMGVKIDPSKDVVKVGNRVLQPVHKGIVLLNKPARVVSTLSDPEGRPTVADYLTAHYRSYFPVGRLDFDSTGLVIMTNDGELAERLMHPRYGMRRVYEVKVKGNMSEETLGALETGVRLVDGIAKAEVKLLGQEDDATALLVTVAEGRNRLVRRMMEKVGHLVKKLKRVQHGPFKLGSLQPGQIRKLTESEYAFMKKRVMGMEQPERGQKTNSAKPYSRPQKSSSRFKSRSKPRRR